MRVPLFFPPVVYVSRLDDVAASPMVTLADLCERAGVPCKASGAWTQRSVRLVRGASNHGAIRSEPGAGAAEVVVPVGLSDRDAARYALVALAYSGLDLVARATVAGLPWSRPSPPVGRPRKANPLTGAQRQRAFRKRHQSVVDLPIKTAQNNGMKRR